MSDINTLGEQPTERFERITQTSTLSAGEQLEISTDSTVYSAEEIEQFLGIRARAVAEIHAGGQYFLALTLADCEQGPNGRKIVVDGQEIELDVDHVLVQPALWLLRQYMSDGSRRGAVVAYRPEDPEHPIADQYHEIGSQTGLFDLPGAPANLFSAMSVRGNLQITVDEHSTVPVTVKQVIQRAGEPDLVEDAAAGVAEDGEALPGYTRTDETSPVEPEPQQSAEQKLIERLQTLALDDREEFGQEIRRVVVNGRGALLIDSMADLVTVGAPVLDIVTAIANNSQVGLVLNNIEYLSDCGVPAGDIIRALGEVGRDYFADLESATDFIWAHRELAYDLDVQAAIRESGTFVKIPSQRRRDDGSYDEFPITVARDDGDGRIRYSTVDEPVGREAERKAEAGDKERTKLLFAVPTNSQWRPSDTTIREAADRLRLARSNDLVLSAIIRRFVAQQSGDAVVTELYHNQAFREMLGGYLLVKLDELAKRSRNLPERVRVNDPANLKQVESGYAVTIASSREYAAMLALAMLDGTFNETRSSHGPIRLRSNGDVMRGQHRAAAQMLLGTWNTQNLPRDN